MIMSQLSFGQMAPERKGIFNKETKIPLAEPQSKLPDLDIIKSAMFKAGQELRQSTISYNGGLITATAGYALISVGVYNKMPRVTVFGAVAAIIGTVFIIESRQHIATAGMHLRLQGIQIN